MSNTLKAQYFLLIAIDALDYKEQIVPAIEVFKDRANKNLWPIYKSTSNRRSIKPGDECLFYIGGKKEHAQHIIATGKIGSIIAFSNKNNTIDNPKLITEQPEKVILFKKINNNFQPISIHLLLDQLNFVPQNKSKWGACLQGGCRKISLSDYNKIIAHMLPLQR